MNIHIYTVRITHNFNQITLINNLNSIQLHSWQVCQWENALNICQIRQQKRHVHLPSSGTTPKACQKLISKSIPLPRDHCYITLYYNIVLYHASFWYINYGGFEILTNHIINWHKKSTELETPVTSFLLRQSRGSCSRGPGNIDFQSPFQRQAARSAAWIK